MSMSVCTGLNPFNFICNHFLQISLCNVSYVGAQQLSERTVYCQKDYFLFFPDIFK